MPYFDIRNSLFDLPAMRARRGGRVFDIDLVWQIICIENNNFDIACESGLEIR